MVPAHGSAEESLTVDNLLDTLSNHVRRAVIYHFEQSSTDTTATLEELITHVEPEVQLATQEELQVSLPHAHLPLLEARGWLEYDTQSETIHYHGRDDTAEYLSDLLSIFTE